MQRKSHWENIYETRAADDVSWYQEHAAMSLALISHCGVVKAGKIIDIGGGASTLVDDLLKDGFANITVLDISEAALRIARERIGPNTAVTWIAADITSAALPAEHYDLWHDRAVFHFLTDEADRQSYVSTLRRAVKPGGHVIVAAFGPEGPLECSDLPIVRYSADTLRNQLGDDFTLIERTREDHPTPFGTTQQFVYCRFRKASGAR